MTSWQEIAGHHCMICKGLATHFYGDITICCDCHIGEPGAGGMTQEFIALMHGKYAGKVIDEEAEIDRDFNQEHFF